MIGRLLAAPRYRLLALVVVFSSVLYTGFLVGRASAAQPRMRAALDRLESARAELQAAEADKGGHRVKAIAFVDDAIAEVKLGIAAGRR